MTDQEAFEIIIEKAIKNGWDMFGYLRKGTIRAKNFGRYYFTNQNYTHTASNHESWKMQNLSIESTTSGGYGAYLHIPVREIVFDHDFAKAYWGENCWLCDKGIQGHLEHDKTTSWQYHLQQTALADNPVKYLGQFLEVNNQ